MVTAFWKICSGLAVVSTFFLVGGVKAQEPSSEQKQEVLTPAQLLEEQNKKFQALESLAHVMNILNTKYVDEKAVPNDVLVEKAIKGIVSGLDPHTIYLSPAELKDFQSDTMGKFGGVGIVISADTTFPEIVEILPDSPAASSGLKVGDVIVSIEGIAINSKNRDDLLTRIRGLANTELVIEIIEANAFAAEQMKGKKPDIEALLATKKFKPKKITMKREIIRSSSVQASALSDGYVYAKIAIFQEDTAESLDKAISTYEDKNKGRLSGLIIDLRNNPGGLFEQAVRVADLFLDSGIIVSTVGRDKNNQSVEYASKRNTHPYMPLVVLVNEKSASASEIVAGALQDHGRAVILGTPTFGKGSVQQLMQLPNGGGLKVTIARYYTPKGRSIQARGIVPDIPLSVSGKGDAKAIGSGVSKKEVDLEGHIDASDLVPTTAAEGFATDIEKWPTKLKSDIQLRVAYSYVKSWERFKNSN